MVYFTADLHLGHQNIIKLCNRPFADLAEMERVIIENWNKRVKRNDTVYVLGDMVWKKSLVPQYLSELSGNKILITGNHDAAWAKDPALQALFVAVAPYLEVHLNCHPITMCHYPMVEWKSSRKDGSSKLGYHIHGHIHNRVAEEYRYLMRQHNALNAGVDINDFRPVTFEELVENNLRFKLAALQHEEDRAYLLSAE